MKPYEKKDPVQGTPEELARWAHSALQRRTYGKRYALVMLGKDSAELVDVETRKFEKIEEHRPEDIVGHYLGVQNRPPKLTVEEFQEDIDTTIRAKAQQEWSKGVMG